MPLLTLRFDNAIGAILVVGLAKPKSVTPGIHPVSSPVRLLVDTGASHTSISPKVAETLQLPILGKRPLRSVTHEVAANIYLADLVWTVGSPITLRDMQLMEFPMADEAFDGLLGRDLLRYCLLNMNGVDGLLTLAS